MTTEFDGMPFDATLLSDVLNHHNITTKALASRSGYDDKSIYRYLSGERTIPTIVLRAAFELTLDMRLVGLISGMVPVAMIVTDLRDAARPVRIPPADQLIRETGEAVKRTADALVYMARILSDGRVDATDEAAITHFQQHSAAAQKCLALVDAALKAHMERTARSS